MPGTTNRCRCGVQAMAAMALPMQFSRVVDAMFRKTGPAPFPRHLTHHVNGQSLCIPVALGAPAAAKHRRYGGFPLMIVGALEAMMLSGSQVDFAQASTAFSDCDALQLRQSILCLHGLLMRGKKATAAP